MFSGTAPISLTGGSVGLSSVCVCVCDGVWPSPPSHPFGQLEQSLCRRLRASGRRFAELSWKAGKEGTYLAHPSCERVAVTMNIGCVTYVLLMHVMSDMPNMYVCYIGWFKSHHTPAG
mmetsp:Transcript_29942/g.86839  ORF Transcript_29942/g.86839 Transcript_29942/m.86839 type:complete len:118 (+) Transcript_29942:1145-1498(+)